MQETKNTLILLRLPFSYLLLPLFIFGAYWGGVSHKWWLALFILHFLVYPSSNGYNSYQDQDKGPIGGLREPPPPGPQLFRLTVFMDILGILLGIFVSYTFAFLVLLYVLFSRAYSYRGIRLKKFAWFSFFIVAFFQGSVAYCMSLNAAGHRLAQLSAAQIWAAAYAFFVLAASYPLTQIYQHKSDEADGFQSLSAKLGINGTFFFVQFCFSLALFCLHQSLGSIRLIGLYLVFNLPTLLFMLWWQWACFRDQDQASFKNTMCMSILGATCLNLFFLFTSLGLCG